MSSEAAPLHTQAILLPLFAFPAWFLCIAPLVWQFRQGNIATGSLILWVVLMNFFLSMNTLIWPRDNIYDWWNGEVWCDINVRIQAGAVVGTTASTAMIVRRLAKVMDTRNISVKSNRSSELKEKALEVIWCWVYPLVLIIVYYVVQPIRYMIYGIVGCLSAYDTSWPTIVLSSMWAPTTTLVAACYAALLIYRLHRYRRDFARLITARNTTKARFIRLFILCIIIILGCLPYTIYLLFWTINAFTDPYDWDRIHDPHRFNTVMRIPSYGKVSWDIWGQVAPGYLVFSIFGTGTDANKLYRDIALAIGLGKLFPNLYAPQDSGVGTPRSFITMQSWTTSVSSKAKNIFRLQMEFVTETTLDSRTCESTLGTNDSYQLQSVSTEEPILQHHSTTHPDATTTQKPSLFQRLFHRQGSSTLLPLFSRPNSTQYPITSERVVHREPPSGVSTRAWASNKARPNHIYEADEVQIVKEVHQDREERTTRKEERISVDGWF